MFKFIAADVNNAMYSTLLSDFLKKIGLFLFVSTILITQLLIRELYE